MTSPRVTPSGGDNAWSLPGWVWSGMPSADPADTEGPRPSPRHDLRHLPRLHRPRHPPQGDRLVEPHRHLRRSPATAASSPRGVDGRCSAVGREGVSVPCSGPDEPPAQRADRRRSPSLIGTTASRPGRVPAYSSMIAGGRSGTAPVELTLLGCCKKRPDRGSRLRYARARRRRADGPRDSPFVARCASQRGGGAHAPPLGALDSI